jgi:transposase-like protein
MNKLYKNKIWLEEQYITQKKSSYQIAKEIKSNHKTILDWLEKFNIQKRPKGKKPELSWDQLAGTTKHKKMRLRLEKDKPSKCSICKKEKRLVLSNKKHDYKEDSDGWWYLCYKCHRNYDMENNKPQFYEKFELL